MRVVALLFVSACGFTISGNPSDGGGIDVPDGVIVDMAIDMAIDVPPPANDNDGDTILDEVDNCPLVANTDQHDEDGDDRGDACDPCPQFAADDADGDGDGIGDACDPRPTMGGDVLVRFDGFGTPVVGAPAPWAVIGGVASDWGVAGDTLQIDSNDTPHFLAIDAGGEHATVDYVVDVSLPGTNTPSASAVVNGDSGFTVGTSCSFVTADQTRRLSNFVAGVFTVIASTSGNVPVPATYRVLLRMDAGTTLCEIAPGGAISTFIQPERTFVGLRVRNLRAAFKYIAVYRSP